MTLHLLTIERPKMRRERLSGKSMLVGRLRHFADTYSAHATVRSSRKLLQDRFCRIVGGPASRFGLGALRARERAANQGLQASIRWAAGAVGYMGGQAAWSAVSSTSGALPVVLSDPETGPVRICWVTAEGGMILVSFDDGHRTERRLSAASVIYRLSPGQMRLATLVVDGHDLSGAADLLGISINTARTHLQRMFDKTGVRSQPALVRVLLSAVAPVV